MKSKKGFTVVELLAVIVVLAIVMGIAAVAITNVLDSTRKNAYVASAKQFIAGAKTLVNADEMNILLGESAAYAPKCDPSKTGDDAVSTKITLSNIKTEGGSNDKSSWGNTIDKANSFVQVFADGNSTTGECTYRYKIYLTDGTYKIGTDAAPVAETELKGSAVTTG